MSNDNQGRNEIRVNNSNAKCLLENWVEERAVGEINPPERDEEVAIIGAKKFKDGHLGLLTVNTGAGVENLTTIRDSYRPPVIPYVRKTGVKQELLEKMLYEQVSQQVNSEFNPPPDMTPQPSVYQHDYENGFVSTAKAPTEPHDYVTEQPVTFWTEHKDKIHGVSQVKTLDTVFRKNASFSTPIEEYVDQPKPYELEQIPKM